MFNTVILYHYTINNDYTRYNAYMKHLVFRYKNINLLLFNRIVIIAVYGNFKGPTNCYIYGESAVLILLS